MAKQKTKTEFKRSNPPLSPFMVQRLCEGGFIFGLCMALFLLLALVTYHEADGCWTHSGAGPLVHNSIGKVGAYLSDILYWCFGYFAYLMPISLGYFSWLLVKNNGQIVFSEPSELALRALGLVLLFVGGCGICSLEPGIHGLDAFHNAGGVIGGWVSGVFNQLLNLEGATLLLLALFLTGLTWLTGLSWLTFTEVTGVYALKTYELLRNLTFMGYKKWQSNSNAPVSAPQKREIIAPSLPTLRFNSTVVADMPDSVTPIVSLPSMAPKPAKRATPARQSAIAAGLPALTLLDKGNPDKAVGGYTHQVLESMSRELEQHLMDFNIQADVVAVHPGPVITRFELQLAAGIKVSKLTTLAKDLARSLSVLSVRVVEVIPGKTVVGLEVPNQNRKMVSLSENLSSDVYQNAQSPITLALGVDIAGHPMVVDLAKMPHLLVAGTTGSGKSVGINAMILSILYKSTPKEVRLIMIDPKMLELSVYDGIPHLLTPVVTDMKEAASSLKWCVSEMERRYRLMSALGVRNLAGFNVKVTEAAACGEPIVDPLWKPTDGMAMEAPLLESLPFVVVIIDELADMMMVVGKKVEILIARIAQKARAAGIHLILATQRPSVDVLTGLIKSNIPTRISFQVSSKIDSRTILDQQGAEQLLGHGDMLYLAPGTGSPLRVHGAYVDDKEVHRVADDWRARGEPQYIDEITAMTGDIDGFSEDAEDTEDADKLYDEAVEFVVETRKASISAVQRRFKIGYNRAARLVEEMERTGILGPLEGGVREVLVRHVDA